MRKEDSKKRNKNINHESQETNLELIFIFEI